MRFAILNASLVPDYAMETIAVVMQPYLAGVAKAWALEAPGVEYLPGHSVAPDGFIPCLVVDHDEAQGVLGYHDRDPKGRPYCRAIFKLVPGGALLCAPDGSPGGACLSGLISHELAETLVDVYAGSWEDGPYVDATGKRFAEVAREICDPVQDDAFSMAVGSGLLVTVSNYVLPAWFVAQSSGEEYDAMRLLTRPLSLNPGGYVLGRNSPDESPTTIEGEHPMAPWRHTYKFLTKGSRTSKRRMK